MGETSVSAKLYLQPEEHDIDDDPDRSTSAGSVNQISKQDGDSRTRTLQEVQRTSREKGSNPKTKQKDSQSEPEGNTQRIPIKKPRERQRTFKCSTCGKSFQTQGYLVSHMRCHSGEKPFTCTQCGKSYRDKNNLKIHLRTHSGELPYLCKHCGKGFTAAGALKKHERTHTGEKPHGCETCGKRFISPAELKCHMRTHTKEKPYFCSKCTSCFSQMSALKKHEMTHSGDRPHKCGECNQAFLGPTKLQEHLIKHHNQDGRYNCSLCGKSFMYAYQLKKHESNHAETKPYGCTVCGRCYESEAALKTHQLVHGLLPDANSGKKKYTCTLCDKTYSTAHGYCKHMSRTHADEADRYVCSICGKEFKEPSSLKKHEMTHSGERPLKCEICEKGFIFALSLKRHKMKHTGELPFKCSTCGQGFFYKTRLTAHIMSHNGVKPYTCTTCGKGFTTSRQYEEHQLVHGASKPYLCSTCGMSFKVRRYLREHVKIHAADNPHRCKFCDKVFTKSTDRLIHERAHTGEKPFKCPTCAKSFACRQRLTRHLKTHTGVKPFSCSECGKNYTELGSLRVHMRRAHSKEEKKKYSCSDCNCVFQNETELRSHMMNSHDNSPSPAAEENSDPIVETQTLDPAEPDSAIVHNVDSGCNLPDSSSFDNNTALTIKETSQHNAIQTAGYLDVLINALTDREPLQLTLHTSTSHFSNTEPQIEGSHVLKLSTIDGSQSTGQNIHSLIESQSSGEDLMSRHFDGGLGTTNQSTISEESLRTLDREPSSNMDIGSSDVDSSQLNQLSHIGPSAVDSPQLNQMSQTLDELSSQDNSHSTTPLQEADQDSINLTNNENPQIISIQDNSEGSQPKTFQRLTAAGSCIGGPMLTPSPHEVQLQPSQVDLDSDPHKVLPQASPQTDTYQPERHSLCYLDSSTEGNLNPTGYIQTYMGSLSNQSYAGLSQLGTFPDINIPVTSAAMADINPTLQSVSSGLMYINLSSDRVYTQVAQFSSDMNNPATSSTSYPSLSVTTTPVFSNASPTDVISSNAASSIGQFSERTDAVFLSNLRDSTIGEFDMNTNGNMNKPENIPTDTTTQFNTRSLAENNSLNEIMTTESPVSNHDAHMSYESPAHYTEMNIIPAQFGTSPDQNATSPDNSVDKSINSHPPVPKDITYDQIPCEDLTQEMSANLNVECEQVNQCINQPQENYETFHGRHQDIAQYSATRETNNMCSISGEVVGESRRPSVEVCGSEMPVNSEQMGSQGIGKVEQEEHVLPGQEPCSCSICGENFNDAGKLKKHVKTHTGSKPYQCALCDTGFVTVYAMKKHMMIHRDERPFQCQVCEKRFRRRAEMDKHFRIHTNERPFPCTVCSKSFRQQSGLNNHLRVHTGEAPYVCEWCGKGFKQSTQMKRHLVVHTGEKNFKCKLCDEAFCYSDALKRHEKIHKSKKPALRCNHCDKLCSSRLHLKRHMALHVSQENKVSVKCPLCHIKFRQQRTLDAHLKKHDSQSETECPICRRQLKSVSALKRHQTTKHKEKKSALQNLNDKACPVSKNYRTRKSLPVDTKDESNLNIPTPKNSDLIPEDRTKHSIKSNMKEPENLKETPKEDEGTDSQQLSAPVALNCSVCGEQFTESGALNRHVRQHTGSHPFKCTTCGRCFTEASTLRKHIGVHRKDKHLCACCGKVYMSVFSLRAHLKIHTEQVCVCKSCGLGFTSWAALKSHTQEAHFPGRKGIVAQAMESKSPVSQAMESKSPVSQAMESKSPVSQAMESKSPVSQAMESKSPVSQAMESKSPVSQDIESKSPVAHVVQGKSPLAHITESKSPEARDVDSTSPAAHVTEGKSPLACSRESIESPTSQIPPEEVNHKVPSLSCSMCKESFSDEPLLMTHMKEHVESEEKKKENNSSTLSTICEKQLATQHTLEVHMDRYQRDVCPSCGEGFPSQVALEEHLYTAHTNYTSSSSPRCSLCNQEFSHSSDLRHHLKTHISEDNKSPEDVGSLGEQLSYTCSVCRQVFGAEEQLKTHLNEHLRERNHLCATCGKGFLTAGQLKIHTRTHTGEQHPTVINMYQATIL